jgi:hypothetical protein
MAEMILYISHKCATDPKFGSTKLNKILYLADFWSYGMFGHAITGVSYSHREHGPAPTRLVPIRKYLIEAGWLLLLPIPLPKEKVMYRPVAVRAASLDDFSENDIALINSAIDFMWPLDADGVSDLTHQMVGWKMTNMDERIPYGTIFLSDEPLSEWEIKKGQEIAGRACAKGLPVELHG